MSTPKFPRWWRNCGRGFLSARNKGWRCCALLVVVLCGTHFCLGQTAGAQDFSKSNTTEKLNQLDQRVTAAQSSADNAWMLVSAALVLMMTGPGLALFYGGLVRRKNTLAIMMQSFALMALITVLWALVGYSLAFGGNGPVIGGFEHAFLRGVGAAPNPDYAGTIPQTDFHGVPADVRDYHAGADYRRDGGADEVQRDGAVHDAVVSRGVRAAGAHGVGQGRISERGAGRKISDAGFCGRDGRAHFFGRIGAGVRALYGQAHRISEAADAAAQPGVEFYRRVPVVGGMVWI